MTGRRLVTGSAQVADHRLFQVDDHPQGSCPARPSLASSCGRCRCVSPLSSRDLCALPTIGSLQSFAELQSRFAVHTDPPDLLKAQLQIHGVTNADASQHHLSTLQIAKQVAPGLRQGSQWQNTEVHTPQDAILLRPLAQSFKRLQL